MYYKMVCDGYILGIGTGAGGVQIKKPEYNMILYVIRTRPEAPEGYEYRLREDLTWELQKEGGTAA